MSGALILTGAPGSGKSSVLDALTTLLEIERVHFGAVESEQLARGYPWLLASEWVPQLAAVVALQKVVGRDTFLVVATTEDRDQLLAVVNAVDAEPVLVVCLAASTDIAAERVAAREPDSWPGKARRPSEALDHARTLAQQIPAIPGLDLVISTVDRAAADVAAEIRQALWDHGILAPHAEVPVPCRSRTKSVKPTSVDQAGSG